MSAYQLLNTLYVTVSGAYLHLDNDTVRIEVERETRLRVPLHHLGGIVSFGDTLISPALIGRCAESGIGLTLLDRNGRFRARIEGPVSGNVLLRKAQYAVAADADPALVLARAMVLGKLKNSRTADADVLRGVEGEAARGYFCAFTAMMRADQRPHFALDGRNRRPPRDAVNALLSFLYTLLTHDCRAALETVGLDPQVGFLHVLRPGRPALALDLAEEFRAVLADRLALTLINRGQLKPGDFRSTEGGGFSHRSSL